MSLAFIAPKQHSLFELGMSSSSTCPSAAVTYDVVLLDGSLARVAVNPADTLLLSLFHSAIVVVWPASSVPHLRLCYGRVGCEPDVLSVINVDVLNAVPVKQFLDRQLETGTNGQFCVAVQLTLRCLCRVEPILCVASHCSTIASIQRQFFAVWHLRTQLPFDANRTLAFYKDDNRSTEWESVEIESLFLPSWLHHGAPSTLSVRVLEGDGNDADSAEALLEDAKDGREFEAEDMITVQIHQLNGRVDDIRIRPRYTVAALKRRIQQRLSIPYEQLRLVFAGKQLEDGRTLVEYSIVNECTVHLVLKLC